MTDTNPATNAKVVRNSTQPLKKATCSVCAKEFPVSLLFNGRCLPCTRAEAEASQHEDTAVTQNQTTIERQKAEKQALRAAIAQRKQEKRDALETASKEKLAKVVDRGSDDRKQLALRELARRQLAKDHLLPFVMRFNPTYEPGWIHKDICEQLEWFSGEVAAGKSPRLILCVPPRHGKSEIASRSLPAWHLGKYPRHEVIACSYSSSLAMSFSRKVRGIVRDVAYENLFETRLDPDSQSAENWLTTSGGGYLAAGVGGPITGRGAHILVIDDPVKNREEAESEVQRQSIWDWYTSTAYTRLAPGGGVLLILTRWHDDDLAGRLIRLGASGMGDQWKIISYPAISEVDEIYRKAGEALHEARYPLEALERIKRAVGPRDWSALYQQNPTASDGDLFKLEMIRFYNQEDLPPWDELNYYTCWDLAVGVKEQNDWTVGVTIALDTQDNIYIVDVHRGRWDSLKTVETILDVFETYRATITGLEKGQIELAIGPLLMKRARERGLQGFSYYPLSTGRKDKVARSRPIQGRMLQGKVFFRANDDRQATLINELLRFPNGVNDDQVDALSHHGILLDTLVAPRTVVIAKPKKSWRDKLSQYTTSGRPKRSFMSC